MLSTFNFMLRIPHALVLIIGLMLASWRISAQVAGEPPVAADTTIIFTPVVPLIGEESRSVLATQGAGVNLLFSGSGWSFGGYYSVELGSSLTFSVDAFFASRRNTDEFEDVYFNNIPVVSQKKNRVFNVPLSLSLRYRLFEDGLQESFRPYIAVGATATAVIVTPYLDLMYFGEPQDRYYEFFESFGHATTTFRPGGFIGLGSSFGSLEKGGTFGVSIRYYVIPYGEPGVVSIRDLPMTSFNGLFITLSIGSAW
jgi:hypothetical protein